jgi:deoxyadenosine/deoxycytidine kinase
MEKSRVPKTKKQIQKENVNVKIIDQSQLDLLAWYQRNYPLWMSSYKISSELNILFLSFDSYTDLNN